MSGLTSAATKFGSEDAVPERSLNYFSIANLQRCQPYGLWIGIQFVLIGEISVKNPSLPSRASRVILET
jgi:hypothetical protein